jgi:sulfate transport system substrate-binding protein
MQRRNGWGIWSLGLLATAVVGCGESGSADKSKADVKRVELLNVSYDPTRELWRDVNNQFTSQYEKEHNVHVDIKQSHGGSASQARQIVDGLEADVATLAMWFDTDALRRKGLLKEGWEGKFPNRSLPYFSTIVFVVRKGNPKNIKDWPDLVRPDVSIITPNPKTGGNGKMSFLAAWGSVITTGGDEAKAKEFVTKLYQQVPVLDTAARAATTTFAQKKIGDVHLTWENEARLEVLESSGTLQVVYPSRSILAEPHVAVVDANVDRHKTREVAEAYLNFLYTEPGQETIARHFYRPSNPEVLKRREKLFPKIELFQVTAVAKDWDDANQKFFADGGVFDGIYKK